MVRKLRSSFLTIAAEPREYALPHGVHVNVHEGERVRVGEQLMDGPSNPHDIRGPRRARLRGGVASCVCWAKRNCRYLVNEIQEVYRWAPQRANSARWGPRRKGVNINDKHIEVISRQMMR